MHCELERLAEQYQAAERQRHFAPRSIVRECASLFAMGDMHDSQVALPPNPHHSTFTAHRSPLTSHLSPSP